MFIFFNKSSYIAYTVVKVNSLRRITEPRTHNRERHSDADFRLITLHDGTFFKGMSEAEPVLYHCLSTKALR